MVGDGLKSEFNQERFQDLAPEAIFSEVILAEVQEFISTMYGAVLRFYLPVLKWELLEDFAEDSINLEHN